MPAGIGDRVSSSGRHLGVDAARLQNGAGEDLNARVDRHPVVLFRIEWNLIFQVSLEVDLVCAPKIRAIRYV